MPLLFLSLVVLAGLSGGRVLHRLWPEEDSATKLGVGGIVALGLLGTWVGLLALVNVNVALASGPILLVTGILLGRAAPLKFTRPEGPSALILLGIVAALGLALIGALAPAVTLEWDTLAYHLAVPKLWAMQGAATRIPNLHHSNFPAAVDALFLFGAWGGAYEATKLFSFGFMLFGVIAAFGLTRARFGESAAWWSALAFATVPLVIWESGTAYIDVAHGLFAGLGLLYAARLVEHPEERRALVLAGICLGLACGSKYSGLLSVAAAVVALAVFSVRKPGGVRNAVLVGVIAAAVGGPWYARNVAWSGNPVFPFYYSMLGGSSWDQRRAEIYSHEQRTFGLGRPITAEQPDPAANSLSFARLPHTILGLAYSPGRYVNPGQTLGLGFPFGSIGAALLCAFAFWLGIGPRRRADQALLVACGVFFVGWFVMSQQSRYVLAISLPLAMLLGAATQTKPLGRWMSGIAGLQALLSLYTVYTSVTSDQMRPALGQTSREEYQRQRIPFAEAAAKINEVAPEKVALYDEVFGYLLNVPYIWANAPHGEAIAYDKLETGAQLAEELKRVGVSHVYFNLATDRQAATRWVGAAGLGEGEPYSLEEKASLLGNLEQCHRFLLADAVRSGQLVPIWNARNGLLLELR